MLGFFNRLYSLKKSCDSFPVALAFVEKSGRTILGFSKITDVQGQQNSCLFESVIIREEDRGKGFGRILMEMTEQYAKGLGVKTAYLNTTDKVGFYARLGYTKCNPVISLGANAHRVPQSMLKHFTVSAVEKKDDLCNEMGKLEVTSLSTPSTVTPLSPQPTSCTQPTSSCSSPPTHQQPAATPSQPPPPPPPPPPPASSNKKPAIVRLDPSQITWMKKEL